MLPLFLFQFGQALDLVIVLVLFFLLYNFFHPKLVSSPFLGLLITIIVIFILVIPYPWFRYFLFAILFLAGIFTNIKPWEW
ncbi:MAG: hypothetical protein V1834_00750 [Candidatus Micrarchaeota archaeon]